MFQRRARSALHEASVRAQAAGFTTLRDVGSVCKCVLSVQDAIRNSQLDGPRILSSGPILAPASLNAEAFPDLYVQCSGISAFSKAVENLAGTGVDLIKVMVSGAVTVPEDIIDRLKSAGRS